jgi:hypothetical protein
VTWNWDQHCFYSFILVHIWFFILVSVCDFNCLFADGKYTNILPNIIWENERCFQKCRSHDGYEVNDEGMCVPTDPKYADQRNVFDDLGQGVLNNAFKGTNLKILGLCKNSFDCGGKGGGGCYSFSILAQLPAWTIGSALELIYFICALSSIAVS